MAEYIEREAIEYPYMTMTLWGLNNATCKAYNEGVKAAADAIAAIPAADVEAVVRCKDCKHYYKSMTLCDHEEGLDCPDKMDFCSFGVRWDAE